MRLLDAMDAAIRDGDQYLMNAVAVSFVEDLPWWEPDLQPLISTFPAGLSNEVDRLRQSGK